MLAVPLLAISFLAISANLHAAPAQESSAQETPSSQPAAVSNPSLVEKNTDDEKTIGAQENVARVETDESAANPQPETTDTGKAPSAVLPDNGPLDGELAEEPSSLMGWGALLIVIGLFVLPTLLGNYFAKQFRMPEHGWKFGLVLGTLAAAGVIVSLGEIKFGPDLSGGITLIYELQNTSAKASEDQQNQNPVETPEADGSDAAGEENASQEQETADDNSSGSRPNSGNLIEQLIAALRERVDPSGTKEVTIRKYGDAQIEIIIPKTGGQQEMDYIMRRISTAGALEFRITASPEFSENQSIIEVAKRLPPGINDVQMDGQKVAEWVAYDLEEFGPVSQPTNRVVKRMAGQTPQALVLTNDGQNVTGDYLRSATAGIDPRGSPAVNFTFNLQGAYRFSRLTGEHLPNPSGQRYHLGIVLDKKLISAPSIESQIRDQGQIHGNFTKESVDFLIGILNAGSLPAALNKDPISSTTISPTLGRETVEMGSRAIVVSLVTVMAFMLVYYRFAGLIACLALGANLLLILGMMILLKAAFTLPGLAGLVLTIGMSVDANVLIFERIREELSRGAGLRMAIRNGFSRATRTIVDANVTTLITAIVIYKIAPDNVKGFGVTLILGILMSMYTAIFVSRVVFDIAERTKRLKALGMRQLIGHTNFDLLSKRGIASAFSLVLIAIGLVGIWNRGKDLLNIDFTGGSSVTMVLEENQPMSYTEVKDTLAETALVDKNLSLVEVGITHTQYTVSCVEEDVQAVQEILHTTFGDQLKMHQVELANLHSIAGGTGSDGTGDSSGNSNSNDPYAGGTGVLIKFTVTNSGNDSAADVGSGTKEATGTKATGPEATGTEATGTEATGTEAPGDAGVNHDTVKQFVQDALLDSGHQGISIDVNHKMYQPGSARRFPEWDVKLALPTDQAQEVLQSLQANINNQPLFPLSNKIGAKVASNMKTAAIAAVLASLVGIVAYIWFRFHGVIYGLAAVVALVHDVAVTMGAIALSAYLVDSAGPLAGSLMIEKFQISLPIVAALLTIIGYSLNDTIVVFDRIREVKGKSPRLTAEIINKCINQTLSRTLLTSLTTLITVFILYFIGGDGIHGFAFSLVVGVIVGTYSSIFVASPALLWMSNRAEISTSNS
ncbi:MAG: protein translocase subunit SecD [Pirellulales bacterium]